MNPDELRVLTIRQPHASAIVHLGKDVENRSRPTSYRGLVAIHAGMKTDPVGFDVPGIHLLDEIPHGVIIGLAEIVDCHNSSSDPTGVVDQCLSRWAIPGYWHWILVNRRPIKQPVPCRGHLPIFHAPGDVARAVLAQL